VNDEIICKQKKDTGLNDIIEQGSEEDPLQEALRKRFNNLCLTYDSDNCDKIEVLLTEVKELYSEDNWYKYNHIYNGILQTYSKQEIILMAEHKLPAYIKHN